MASAILNGSPVDNWNQRARESSDGEQIIIGDLLVDINGIEKQGSMLQALQTCAHDILIFKGPRQQPPNPWLEPDNQHA